MSDEKKTTAKNAPQAETKETGFVPKIKKSLTLPLIKPKLDEPVYIKFVEPVKIGKQIGDKDAAIIANVINLETGELAQYLVPAVFQGILHDEYGAPRYGTPKKGDPVEVLEKPLAGQTVDAYVGCGFAVTKHPKQSGKEYHPHTIQELEL
jgi:hypothetical protein